MAAVVSRYARALADLAMEKHLDPAQTVAELNGLAGVVAQSQELRTVLENPSVPSRQKLAVLDSIVARFGVSRYLRNFVAVVMDHRRIAALPEIARQFALELDSRLGFAEAEITSARELAEEEKRDLTARLEKLTGKKIRPRYHRDPQVLGGALIRIGSTVYDGTVRGQLRRLKEQLAGT